jgi:O-succinylbenzoate synthase
MKMTIPEKHAPFVAFVVDCITKEMSGIKRMRYSYQLAEIIGGSKDEVLRAVEAKTKAKDRGRVLEIIDGHKDAA